MHFVHLHVHVEVHVLALLVHVPRSVVTFVPRTGPRPIGCSLLHGSLASVLAGQKHSGARHARPIMARVLILLRLR